MVYDPLSFRQDYLFFLSYSGYYQHIICTVPIFGYATEEYALQEEYYLRVLTQTHVYRAKRDTES